MSSPPNGGGQLKLKEKISPFRDEVFIKNTSTNHRRKIHG
jgi:hypothetical protein